MESAGCSRRASSLPLLLHPRSSQGPAPAPALRDAPDAPQTRSRRAPAPARGTVSRTCPRTRTRALRAAPMSARAPLLLLLCAALALSHAGGYHPPGVSLVSPSSGRQGPGMIPSLAPPLSGGPGVRLFRGVPGSPTMWRVGSAFVSGCRGEEECAQQVLDAGGDRAAPFGVRQNICRIAAPALRC